MEKDASLSRALLDLVSAVKRILRQEFNVEADTKAPTFTQFRILHKIKNGVCHVGKLSEAFGISQPATSIMVNTMVKEGLLKRVPHPTDRRQIELRLTPKATAKLNTGFQRAFSKIEEKLSPLSATKKSEITRQILELSHLLSGLER
jgi:DNA-binding MarR family transcriptional regulator